MSLITSYSLFSLSAVAKCCMEVAIGSYGVNKTSQFSKRFSLNYLSFLIILNHAAKKLVDTELESENHIPQDGAKTTDYR